MRGFRFQWLALMLLGASSAYAAWPEIPVPSDAQAEAIGDEVRLNGIPMRMHRILSHQSVKDILGFYRDALGPRLAERNVAGSTILSQERGDYFITVKVRPLSAKLNEVLVSASDMVEAKRAANRPLGFSLPANSMVMSDMESLDAGKRSRQLVVSNRQALGTNIQVLTQELAVRGFGPDGAPVRDTDAQYVQQFKGDGREAQLTVVRQAGISHIVLTTIFNP